RTTSSAKSRYVTQKPLNQMPSTPWLHLEILSIKVLNRIGEKRQPWWSPTPTGKKSDILLAIQTKLLLHLHRNLQGHLHMHLFYVATGMLLAGLVLRNVPYITSAVYIDSRWSTALRNIALAIILTRAGLGLDALALRKLKAVCVRVAVGPCTVEACTVAVVSHFLMSLPWIWSFLLGFVLSAVSPAVVVPSMLLLQKEGFGVEKGIPTLLMAAGSFDDILAITGFSACLGMAFATGSTWSSLLKGILEVLGGLTIGLVLGFFLRFFPSADQAQLVMRRAFLLLGLSVLAVFGSRIAGFSGAGGLCTLVMAFLAGLSWRESKVSVKLIPVAGFVGMGWTVFQPLLFGLIGAEISVTALDVNTVGESSNTGLVVRVLFTFTMVLFAGFTFKEKVFIALAWLPKATVQAAIGSTALDMAQAQGDAVLEKFGMDILTVAVLAILTTAPIGALSISLAGPRLLQRSTTTSPENPRPEGDHTYTQGETESPCHIPYMQEFLESQQDMW
uniref:Sodium/hydrogen exchanger 9B2-like n=1 Tax=Paramormyrops kingsleyae TaxID=1676925 RepID=A0A3B3TBX0_9TELE